MPELEFTGKIKWTVKEAVEALETSIPLQTAIAKQLIETITENPAKAFELGVAQAAYVKGATSSLFDFTKNPPGTPFDLYTKPLQQWQEMARKLLAPQEEQPNAPKPKTLFELFTTPMWEW
jgi:hypothetical protein